MTKTTATPIMPCPLCGGPAELWPAQESPYGGRRKAWIGCQGKCFAVAQECETDEEAIKTWNDRAGEGRLRCELDASTRLSGAFFAYINQLKEALRDCADELEVEIKARYEGTLQYPVQQRRFQRDQSSIERAKAILEAAPTDHHVEFAKLPLNISSIKEGYRIIDFDGNFILDIHNEPLNEEVGFPQCFHADIASKLTKDGEPVLVCTKCGKTVGEAA